jgi:Fe-S-cluster containining protein
MDKRLVKAVDDIESNALGLEDTFTFKCRACGKCCKNRDDIILTTRDLFNIARSLGRTIEYIIERYCETYIGETSRTPIVRLKPIGAEQICPLLVNRRCIVHTVKPTVCAMFPLGRGTKFDISEKGAKIPEKCQPIYFIQSNSCGTQNKTQTVRYWLNLYGIPVEDEFYSLWTKMVSILSDTFHKFEILKIPEKDKKFLWDYVFHTVYISYDIDKELMPQFQENVEKLLGLFRKLMAETKNVIGGMRRGA